jgi:hypothetical protein
MKFFKQSFSLFARSSFLIVFTALLFISSPVAYAQMTCLSDAELSSVYAAGFSSFSITNGLARADLNINISTYTEIDSLKMGYWNNGSLGWDEDWTDVILGGSSSDPTQDLLLTGIYFEAKFTNIDNPSTRTLDYVRIGTSDIDGIISATFNSFTGEVAGTTYNRSNLGATSITAQNNKEFYIELSRTQGFRFYWEDATIP